MPPQDNVASSEKTTSPKIMGPYSPHNRVRTPVVGTSLAKQSMADECDINNIMKQFDKTGLLAHVTTFNGDYAELPSEIDFHQAMTNLTEASAAFESLPAKIRNKFHNNPAEFLEFVHNDENEEALIDLGLAKRAPPLVPEVVEGSPEPSPVPGDPSTPATPDTPETPV